MNIMLNQYLSMVFVLASVPGFAGSLTGVTEKDVCTVKGSIGPKLQIELTIKMSPASSRTGIATAGEGWTDDFLGDMHPVQQVDILINGNSVLIPNSCFADLGSVKNISIHEKKGQIIVIAECGSGGDSMSVIFTIAPSRRLPGRYAIVERVRKSGEFGSDVWERTTYHNAIWDNPSL